MRVTILGSGTLVPHPERGAPGLAVTTGTETILFDSGSGTLYRLARAGLDWREISTIFYTHYHPDHTLDLVSILFAANFAPGAERTTPLHVHGPRGLISLYEAIAKAWPSVVPNNYHLDLRQLEPGEKVESPSGGWNVQSARTAHGDSAGLAYRVNEGDTCIVYTGDTEYCEALVGLARGADLLISECSADDSHRTPGHLCPSDLARLVRESGVERVLLTHIYAPLNPDELAAEVRKNCRAEVSPARDFFIYEV